MEDKKYMNPASVSDILHSLAQQDLNLSPHSSESDFDSSPPNSPSAAGRLTDSGVRFKPIPTGACGEGESALPYFTPGSSAPEHYKTPASSRQNSRATISSEADQAQNSAISSEIAVHYNKFGTGL